MTVDTPFPDRPATPYWDPRGKWGGGMGALQYDAAGNAYYSQGVPVDETVEVLKAITAGANAATQSLYPYQIPAGTCPVGMVFNPQLGTCQPGVAGTFQASGNSGLILLLIAGVVIFFMNRGGR